MRSTEHSLEALVRDPLFPRLKEHLLESTGLRYYVDKDDDFSRRVGQRLSKTGLSDCASYLNLLRDPVGGPAELEALIAEVTIGETYFFRHQEHFEALRDLVLPDIIARNRASRRLRIWCAGCADGSEPYSLAILLKRDLELELAGWNVTILGTDINRRALARAREGKFEEWAFRSTPDELRRSCFVKEGRSWTIAPEYKNWISFQYHNLAEDSFPSPLNNLFGFDLIICRNVMIYFGPDLMEKVVRRFHDCLSPEGWLLVGPSEPNMTFFSSFRVVNAPGATLYQRPDAPDLPQVVQAWISGPVVQMPPVPAPQVPVAAESSAPEKLSLVDVRRYADQGSWEAALECCSVLLKQDNLNSRVYFYQALILNQMSRYGEAERCLRQAIYLNRQSVLAHYYLGLLAQSQRDSPQAVRSFENALELLRSFADDYIFADADGIHAAELKKLATSNLEVLREGNEASAH